MVLSLFLLLVSPEKSGIMNITHNHIILLNSKKAVGLYIPFTTI